jgi:hypothetical protein
MGDWVTGNFNAVKIPWFTNGSASETDSHDEDDFDDDEKDRQNPSGKVTQPSGESEKMKELGTPELNDKDLKTVKSSVFKQRANSNVVQSYAADKAQEDERLAAADAGPQADAEQVKRADNALKDAQNALNAARESLAKAELALRDTKAEFMRRKNDRERQLTKKAAKQQKNEHKKKHGPNHGGDPFSGFVMGIYAKSTSKFTVLMVSARAPTSFPPARASLRQ